MVRVYCLGDDVEKLGLGEKPETLGEVTFVTNNEDKALCDAFLAVYEASFSSSSYIADLNDKFPEKPVFLIVTEEKDQSFVKAFADTNNVCLISKDESLEGIAKIVSSQIQEQTLKIKKVSSANAICDKLFEEGVEWEAQLLPEGYDYSEVEKKDLEYLKKTSSSGSVAKDKKTFRDRFRMGGDKKCLVC